MPVADLTITKRQVIQLLNADTSGVDVTSATDDRFNAPLFIPESIFEADEDVFTACAESIGHWARADMLTLSSDLSNGDVIPTHIGDLGRVVIKRSSGETIYYPATTVASAEEITRYRENDSNSYGLLAHDASGSAIAGLFHITEEDLIFFTGYRAKVWLITYTRTAALQSPAIYTAAIVCGAVARLLKEGGNVDRAGYFGQMFAGYLQMIRGNEKAIPQLAAAAA